MKMKTLAKSIVLTMVVLAASGAPRARAGVLDGPWDWSSYDAIIASMDGDGKSICGVVAEETGNKALRCTLDHAAWDKFYASETKKRFKERDNSKSPDNCRSGIGFFRSYSDNEHMPDPRTSDGKPVIGEFNNKVHTLVCTFDDTQKSHYLTYDAATKTLVLHITRAPLDNNNWVGDELKRMSGQFPAINKFWNDGHNM